VRANIPHGRRFVLDAAPPEPRKSFAIVGEAQGALRDLVTNLAGALKSCGFTRSRDAGDASFVVNVCDADNPRPFRRKSRGTFVAALYGRADVPTDALRETYPMLVRALANISLGYVPGHGV
jgi:hypothetical protein